MFFIMQGAGIVIIAASGVLFYKEYEKLRKKYNFLVARWNEFTESSDYKEGKF